MEKDIKKREVKKSHVVCGKHQFGMDGYLKGALEDLKSNLRKNYDAFLIVSGREGFGKSTLAAQIAVYMDHNYNIDRCCFTPKQFVEAADKANKFEAVVFDETAGFLSSRGAMSSFNRDLIKVFSEMRHKNLVIILCIPNFFEMDRYPALHRSEALLHVYKRTKFASYDYKRKHDLYLKGKKAYKYIVHPNFTGTYVQYFPLNVEAYEMKKKVSTREIEQEKEREIGIAKIKHERLYQLFLEWKEKGMTQKEMGVKVGLSQSMVNEILRNGAKSTNQ